MKPPRPRGSRTSIWILGLGAALLLSVGLQAAMSVSRGASRTLAVTADTSARPGDVAFGPADAPVTIIALVSLTCSHCRNWEEREMPVVLRELVDAGRARLVLRAFPLDNVALTGAALLSCLPPAERAAAQMAMMKVQGAWEPTDTASISAAAGLSPERAGAAAACAGAPEAAHGVLEAAMEAKRSWGVAATPTFVVGRQVRPGALPAAVVASMVDTAER